VLPATLGELDPPPEVGPVEAAWQLYASSLSAPDNDPRSVIVACAMRLAQALDRAGDRELPGVAREFRTYVAYAATFGQEADQLDVLRAKRALSRVDSVLSAVEA
jgi:hypothetical protein